MLTTTRLADTDPVTGCVWWICLARNLKLAALASLHPLYRSWAEDERRGAA